MSKFKDLLLHMNTETLNAAADLARLLQTKAEQRLPRSDGPTDDDSHLLTRLVPAAKVEEEIPQLDSRGSPHPLISHETLVDLLPEGAPVDEVESALESIDEPPLCDEQIDFLRTVLTGQNIFLTGEAGCGKSTVIRVAISILQTLGKGVFNVAPTGRAALAIGGKTTWSYLGITPNTIAKGLSHLEDLALSNFQIQQRLLATDVLFMDEVSMLDRFQLERMDAMMRLARSSPDMPLSLFLPFGGVQIIATGDFFQLPPVDPFHRCLHCGDETLRNVATKTWYCPEDPRNHWWQDGDQWAFASDAWKVAGFKYQYLRRVHRQDDAEFVQLLRKCRFQVPLTERELDRVALFQPPSATASVATSLYSTRKEANSKNEKELGKLPGSLLEFPCLDSLVTFRGGKHPELKQRAFYKTDDQTSVTVLAALCESRFESLVKLKVGMKVVLLVNLKLEIGLCNGSQGVIIDFTGRSSENAETDLPNVSRGDYQKIRGEQEALYAKIAQSRVARGGGRWRGWPVVKFENVKNPVVIYPHCMTSIVGSPNPESRVEYYGILCRTQIPLAAAWAMTIHRSQGMTLRRLEVDLNHVFNHAQTYVALSRAASLDGLCISDGREKLMEGKGADPAVVSWYQRNFGFVPGMELHAEAFGWPRL